MFRIFKNINDEVRDFDYKKLCFEWKERVLFFYIFFIVCVVIKNSKKKDFLECLFGVVVVGIVFLK